MKMSRFWSLFIGSKYSRIWNPRFWSKFVWQTPQFLHNYFLFHIHFSCIWLTNIFRWSYFQTLCGGSRDVIIIDIHDFEALEYDKILSTTSKLAVELTTTMDKMLRGEFLRPSFFRWGHLLRPHLNTLWNFFENLLNILSQWRLANAAHKL